MKKTLIGIVALLVLLAVILGLWISTKGNSNRPGIINNNQTSTGESTSSGTDIREGYGVVTGSLGYPSEFIPEDIIVCAENLSTSHVTCTNEHLQGDYTYGIGYKISGLPEGEYYVYAYLPENPETKAYYSEFVVCGLSIECPSHEPIVINVREGETSEDVNPIDWYEY